jgi:hypothetical protein
MMQEEGKKSHSGGWARGAASRGKSNRVQPGQIVNCQGRHNYKHNFVEFGCQCQLLAQDYEN